MRTHRLTPRDLIPAAASLSAAVLAAALLVAPARTGIAQGAKKTIDVDFVTKVWSTRQLNDQTIHTGSEGVVIKSEDSTMKTDRAVYNETTGVATAPGRIQLDDAQNTLTGDKGVAYYKRRDAEITGNVKIVARPKPSSGAGSESRVRREFKEPVTITCDKVVYNWKTRKAVLTGNLTLKQKDRTVTATRGLYDGLLEKVELVGNIRSVRPGKEDIKVPGNSRAIAIVREGAEQFDVIADKNAPAGQNTIQASLAIEEEEEEQGGAGATPPPATPPSNPPTTPPSNPPATPPPGQGPPPGTGGANP